MIRTQRLENGLDLTFMDQSRQIAKDRWYVCITVQIHIPIEKKWLAPYLVDDLKFQDIRHVLGDTILFEQKKDRNFVSANQKDDVVKDIFDNTMDTTKRYLGLDVFPAKYILKKYTEKMRHI